MKYTYIILNLFTILPAIIFSFDKKLRFYKKWKYTFPGITAVAVCFTVWDYYFTLNKVWQFNPAYVLDFRLFLMPIEEYLFFLFTPFTCLFIYESVSYYYKPEWAQRMSKPVALFLAMICAGISLCHTDRIYTFINFSLAAIVLMFAFSLVKKEILGQFWVAFFIHLIPFWIVNGVLTSWPVLVYDEFENINIRIGTIPLEDHAYSLILFLSNLCAYEWFKKKNQLHGLQSAGIH